MKAIDVMSIDECRAELIERGCVYTESGASYYLSRKWMRGDRVLAGSDWNLTELSLYRLALLRARLSDASLNSRWNRRLILANAPQEWDE